MQVTSIVNTAESGAAASQTRLADDFDNFLKLLTAQLANQDPLDPLDSNEFVEQLVSFTGVEQAVNTNQNLENMIDLFKSGQTASAVSYLGTTVETAGNAIRLTDGQAPFHYSLPESAKSTSITVADASGSVVFSGEGQTTAGEHELIWDGRNFNGVLQEDGIYTLKVSALDNNGGLIPTSTRISGQVTGIETIDNSIMLTVNGAQVPIEDISKVRETIPTF
jgi:flagellar basal-body rod modification protein FlgD